MGGELVVFRSGTRLCALAVPHVEESMRPLPVESLPGVPAFVRGTSIIRGTPTPVVDLRALLGDDAEHSPRRLLTVKVGRRRVGLLVDEVLGLRDASAIAADVLPPLLADAAGGVLHDLARLDAELLTVLRAGSLVPVEVWERLESAEAT